MEFHKKVLNGAEETVLEIDPYDKAGIEDLKKESLVNKKILLRVDYNVPIDKSGNITDDERIIQTIPTIKYLLNNGVSRISIVSHLGRPRGNIIEKDSLAVVAKRLNELLDNTVLFIPIIEHHEDNVSSSISANYQDYLKYTVTHVLKNPGENKICLLENIRFDPREGKNSSELAAELAKDHDIFVNDSFGAAHREHASTKAITDFLPACAGLLIKKELSVIGKAITNPGRPAVAIIGGSKVSSKIDVLENLLEKVDTLVIGGGMAYTFLKAQGHSIGNSLLEENLIDKAGEILKKAAATNVKIILPVDHVAGKDFDNETEIFNVSELTDNLMGLDIGKKTVGLIEDVLETATTVIWNGPVGAFEMPNFAAGTYAIVRKMAEITTNNKAVTIVGGGDSGSAVKAAAKHDLALALAERNSVDKNIFNYPALIFHISTGGGASLEFMEGKKLPGIEALDDRSKYRQGKNNSQQDEQEQEEPTEEKEEKKN